VSSVDLTQSPPLLSIGGQGYKLTQILSVTQPLGSGGNATNGISNALSSFGL